VHQEAEEKERTGKEGNTVERISDRVTPGRQNSTSKSHAVSALHLTSLIEAEFDCADIFEYDRNIMWKTSKIYLHPSKYKSVHGFKAAVHLTVRSFARSMLKSKAPYVICHTRLALTCPTICIQVWTFSHILRRNGSIGPHQQLIPLQTRR
jgi:hypothetical protein